MADERETTAPLLFTLGLVAFLGSLVAFLADLVTGHDVLRSLVVNGAGAGVLVSWAAIDTLGDPEARVSTASGAAGTAVLLYGLYMVLAGLVVAGTTFRHGHLELGLWLAGSGAVAVLGGYLVFPREAVLQQVEEGPDTDDPGERESEEEATPGDDATGDGTAS